MQGIRLPDGILSIFMFAFMQLEKYGCAPPSEDEMRTIFGPAYREPDDPEDETANHQLIYDNFGDYLDQLCKLGYYIEFRITTGYEAFMHLF
jgi:hypothetical protein